MFDKSGIGSPLILWLPTGAQVRGVPAQGDHPPVVVVRLHRAISAQLRQKNFQPLLP